MCEKKAPTNGWSNEYNLLSIADESFREDLTEQNNTTWSCAMLGCWFNRRCVLLCTRVWFGVRMWCTTGVRKVCLVKDLFVSRACWRNLSEQPFGQFDSINLNNEFERRVWHGLEGDKSSEIASSSGELELFVVEGNEIISNTLSGQDCFKMHKTISQTSSATAAPNPCNKCLSSHKLTNAS